MNFLLDTNTFLWFINGDERLSIESRKVILNPENLKFVSIVSLWEIAIKNSIGKLELKNKYDFLFGQIEENGFGILQINPSHLSTVNKLLFHHRDPFDRLLISQALSEKMIIITRDAEFKKYKVVVKW